MAGIRVWPDGVESEAVELDGSGVLSFGRVADLVVDPDNRYLHRVLGQVSDDGGCWRLANIGSRVVLQVCRPGERRDVPVGPGAQIELGVGENVVTFAAGQATYAVIIEVADAGRVVRGEGSDSSVEAGLDTALPGANVVLTPAHRQILVLMCEPALRALGRPDWTIPGNEELARRLFISPKTAEKHVAEVCRRFAEDGVRGLHAQVGQPIGERRRILVEHAVRTGVVTRADLDPAG